MKNKYSKVLNGVVHVMSTKPVERHSWDQIIESSKDVHGRRSDMFF